MVRRSLALVVCVLLGTPAAAEMPFSLASGDRVVLLGNTLIEREQSHGYWEMALTRRFPQAAVVFRNLGWSGDTVWGHARAGFGSQAEGFRHLKEHVLVLKPTVLIIGYGTNESFDGAAGLPRFVAGLETLLETLAPTKARLILLSPLRQENLGRPLPDPTAHNKHLRMYADAVHDVAKKRNALFVDLFKLLPDGATGNPPAPLTDNGVHLTSWGYWKATAALEQGLGLPETAWQVTVRVGSRKARTEGARVEILQNRPLQFRVTEEFLPLAPPPAPGSSRSAAERGLHIRGLPEGRYTLTIDEKEICTASATEWAAGVAIHHGPELEQAEALRKAIVAKNELYFHRWRPQNETYLFGFRKGEQGKNAVEIPQFDPLIEKKEAEIASLREPVPHTYQVKVESR
jgi:lysophospholipase L1-like esterase